jgi:hypothetical protein
MMNQRQAGNVLRKNAPQGEHPAFINQKEANWLKGMGGSGKKTKSGLRSYAVNEAPDQIQGSTTNAFGNEISVDTQNKEHQRVRDLPQNVSEGVTSTVEGVTNAVGGGGMETRNNTNTSTSNLDQPTTEFRDKIYGSATDVMDTPYESYGDATGNDRFADANTDTLNAYDTVREAQGTGQKQYGEASDIGSAVGKYESEQVGDQSFLKGPTVDEYMNPHTSNVINANTDQAMKAMQMGRNQLGAKAQMAGAGMGSRSAIEKGVMAGEVMSNLNQQNYNALNSSFEGASDRKRYDMDSSRDADKYNVDSGLRDADTRLRGAKTMTDATDSGRNATYTDASALSAVGADIEGRENNNKDFAYDEYVEERDWDKNNTSFASNVLSGSPSGTETTNTNPQYKNPKVDRFGKIIAGAGSGWLATGSPYGAAAGGVLGAMG